MSTHINTNIEQANRVRRLRLSPHYSTIVILARTYLYRAHMKVSTNQFKQTPWPLVRTQTIPTERLPLVDEILVPTFVDRGLSRGQRGGSLTVVNLSFLGRSRYFSFK
jgi:hypothetical protein